MQTSVQSAALVAEDKKPPAASMSPAQRRGLKYQAKVEEALSALYSGRVILRPWFRYKTTQGKVLRCQPDAVVLSSDWDWACVVEIKISTIPECWRKLNDVYLPVVKRVYRIPVFASLVTTMFDPHVGFPCKISQLEGLERLGEWKGEGLGVVSWK